MFRTGKEKEQESKELPVHKSLEFKKLEPISIENSLNETEFKNNRIESKIVLKAKKIKTPEESIDKGKANLLSQPKEPEMKQPAPLDLCPYSDDEK